MSTQIISKSKIFQFEDRDGIFIISMDDPNQSVNTFTKEMLEDVDEFMPKILLKKDLKGIIITSLKKNCFAAGADISIFETLKTQEDGKKASQELHRIFSYFANAQVPTVSAIHGVCLGGGLELSLACHYRICTTHVSTQLGLPEVLLGILPGGGGSQRLPRLVGIPNALDLILTGKKLDGKKALKMGLVDDCVAENQLLDKAIALCKKSKARTLRNQIDVTYAFENKFSFQKLILQGNTLGRKLIESQAQKTIFKNTKGKYPAPYKALESVVHGCTLPLEKGLELEAKLFGELVVTLESRALVHIYFMTTKAKKNPYQNALKNDDFISNLKSGTSSVGILGAGLMGSGISTVLADKNVRSVMIDKDASGIQRGLKAISSYFDERFQKRRIRWFERDLKKNCAEPSLNFQSLKNVPVVIEAVFEDLKIKQDVLKKCEENIHNKDFIFATNTSSIPVTDIAKSAKNPENVVGMHFFSPVPKMPLVEIITTKQTTDIAAGRIFELANLMGKYTIVVNDGPGFYTTRILAFQIAEALNILAQGAKIEQIDKTMEKFGMPVGPMTLLDEVGIDIGEHIIHVLKNSFKDRIVVPTEIENIGKENRKGRKNNFGFYLYKNGKKQDPDETIYKHFSTPRNNMDIKEIEDRLVYIFLNEAAICLDENILRS